MEAIDDLEHRHTTANAEWAVCIVKYVCYSMLSFCLYEWFITLPFEFGVLWRKDTPRYTRCLYAFPRYVGLFALLVNAIAISLLHDIFHIPPSTCRWWHAFQLATSGSILLVLEVMLMTRIYALFNRKLNVYLFLATVLCTKTVAEIALGILTIRQRVFGDACLALSTPTAMAYSTGVEMAIQLMIWGLTLYKWLRTRIANGWKEVPLMCLVTRDGSWSFFVLITICIFAMRDAIMALDPDYPTFGGRVVRDILYPIQVAAYSFISCRMIMNMQHFNVEEEAAHATPSQLPHLSTVQWVRNSFDSSVAGDSFGQETKQLSARIRTNMFTA